MMTAFTDQPEQSLLKQNEGTWLRLNEARDGFDVFYQGEQIATVAITGYELTPLR